MTDLPGASDALRELASRGVRHSYRKGRLLIEEGDRADTIYIVLSGRVRVYSAHPDNGREITYGTYGAGEYVGEMSLDGGLRSASVETLENTVCAAVARPTLEAFIAERPAFAFELLSKVIRRARSATLTARQLALNDAYGNLKAWLDAEAVTEADGTRWIASRPTHRELAFRIGRSREMVSRLLKDLEEGGYVSVQGQGWRLTKVLPARW
ncbi:MAG: Crp/Fnr family transcriptional regulator [Rubrivivax sp.]|nr:Crp/Fnr family transcriptional regulator [Rubrivivax sp.]